MGDIVGQAAEATEGWAGVLADAGNEAIEYGETMSATWVSWADDLTGAATSVASVAAEVEGLGSALGNLPSGVTATGGIDVSAIPDISFHDGGLVGARHYHGGGLTSPLLPDEIAAILQIGEHVTPERSVTPWTLPQLDYIRRTGQPVPTGGGGSVVQHNTFNLHFQSAPKDDDEMRDFAERLDRIMRDVAKQSYGGA